MNLNIESTSATEEIPGVYAAKQKRSVRIRDTYIQVGAKLLNSSRFKELTVSNLAHECGYSVGSFYTRFQDKEVYFLALRSEAIAASNALVDERLGDGNLDHLAPGQGLDELVDLLFDIFTSTWRGVLRESLLRILEPDDPWAPMRDAARRIIRYYQNAFANRFEAFSEEETLIRLRFCFQLIVGALQNDLVNDYHVFTTRDQSLRRGLKEAVRAYMRIPAN